jgi:preprotein translocase subunit SecE
MNGRTETTGGGADTFKLVVALAIVAGGVFGFYWWADQPTFMRVGTVLGSVVLAALVAAQTQVGRNAWDFIVSSRTEVRKVVWPNRTETTQTTLYVIIMVIIIGIFLWLLDMFLLWATRLLTGQGG